MHAVFGCFVEAVDHGGVLKGVHFEDDASLLALIGEGYFTVDEAVQLRMRLKRATRRVVNFGSSLPCRVRKRL